MCFSNLPIEFDEHGDPYLAEEADAVERPTCGCGADDVPLAEDPAEAFDALIQAVPEDVREQLRDPPEVAPDGGQTGGD